MTIFFLVLVGLLILIFGYGFYKTQKMRNTPDVPNSEKIKVLSDKTFATQIKNNVVLVDFWASWCMPCKMMAPILNEVAEQATSGVTIGKLNVEHNQATATKYKVRSIPTMILFKDGKEVTRIVGVKSKDFVLKEIAKVK
ncbi:thioredoxin [Microbacter margulisiae]|uniref:Thioredoxin n=1 Tax=Microbacter margulisiae TaxID=1350067 RepID=A0A7W5DS72_9PORP|nr:thioredoxin [Microbacter margulisiae]MBB3187629.1 thioredoxin 1 [Microbacter margulisiae]